MPYMDGMGNDWSNWTMSNPMVTNVPELHFFTAQYTLPGERCSHSLPSQSRFWMTGGFFQKVGQIGNAQASTKIFGHHHYHRGHHDHDLTWPTAVGKLRPYKCVICVFISWSLPLLGRKNICCSPTQWWYLSCPNPMSINSFHETPTKTNHHLCNQTRNIGFFWMA